MVSYDQYIAAKETILKYEYERKIASLNSVIETLKAENFNLNIALSLKSKGFNKSDVIKICKDLGYLKGSNEPSKSLKLSEYELSKRLDHVLKNSRS